jgi:hypothetical protein
LAEVRANWARIVRAVEEQSASLAFVLKVTKPTSLEGRVLTLDFQFPFHKDKVLGDLRNRKVLDAALRQVTGGTLQLDGRVAPQDDASDVQTVPRDAVGAIMQVFGGVLEEGKA